MAVDLFKEPGLQGPQASASGPVDLFKEPGLSPAPQIPQGAPSYATGGLGLASSFVRGVTDPIAQLLKSNIIPGTGIEQQLLKYYHQAAQSPQGVSDNGPSAMQQHIVNTLGSIMPSGIANTLLNKTPSLQELFPMASDFGQNVMGQNIAHGIGGLVPAGIAAAAMPASSALRALPIVGRALAPAAQQMSLSSGLFGAAEHPEHPVLGGLAGTAEGLAVGQIPGIIGAAVKGIKGIPAAFQALKAPEEAQKMYEAAVGKLPEDVMNTQNNQAILDNAEKQVEIANTKYKDVKDTAEASGFASDFNPGGIKIKPYPQLRNTLDDVSERLGVSPKLLATIERYKNNPTYDNAHALQSHLGKEAARIGSLFNKTPEDDLTVQALKDARNSVNTRIEQAFERSGNKNLIKKYNDASDFYKKNVVPYREKPEIARVLQGGQFPTDIISVISRDDPDGYNKVLRKHIAQNPFQSRTFMAQALAQHVTPANSKVGLTLSDIVNGYENIPSVIKDIGKSVQLSKNMKSFKQSALIREKASKAITDAAKVGAGALGIGYGLKKLHDIL
jgi:hypothetical protein